MLRNIIGWALLAVAVLITLVLLTYGGPVLPHIIGPVALAIVGGGVLLTKKLSQREPLHGKQDARSKVGK